MTLLLEKAFQEAAKLPEQEQDTFAAWILEELESDLHWDALFAQSQDLLAALADEALAEYHRGETQLLDPDLL